MKHAAALVLILALSVTTFAGDVGTPPVPPPPQGQSISVVTTVIGLILIIFKK